jgi:RNA 2',3'-cyclic 3'-phosphodiesterase
MTRTFIALEQDESLRRHLSETIRRMVQALPQLKWVDPAGIHLTLAFLGELTDEQLAKAVQASDLAAQQVSPFRYRLAQLGTFSSPRQPRVIWAGVDEPTGKLTRLHRLLGRELEQRDFEGEARPFSPHLTLARVKEPLSSTELQTLQRLLADPQLNAPSPYYHAQHICVMKSELSRSGARYTLLHDSILEENSQHE